MKSKPTIIPFGEKQRPIIPVRISTKRGSVVAQLLVDTGADVTIVRESLLMSLSPEEVGGGGIIFGGAAGRALNCYMVDLEILGHKFEQQVVVGNIDFMGIDGSEFCGVVGRDVLQYCELTLRGEQFSIRS